MGASQSLDSPRDKRTTVRNVRGDGYIYSNQMLVAISPFYDHASLRRAETQMMKADRARRDLEDRLQVFPRFEHILFQEAEAERIALGLPPRYAPVDKTSNTSLDDGNESAPLVRKKPTANDSGLLGHPATHDLEAALSAIVKRKRGLERALSNPDACENCGARFEGLGAVRTKLVAELGAAIKSHRAFLDFLAKCRWALEDISTEDAAAVPAHEAGTAGSETEKAVDL